MVRGSGEVCVVSLGGQEQGSGLRKEVGSGFSLGGVVQGGQWGGVR